MLAADKGVPNASWVQMQAEELPGALGTFDVVTFAASFHWMDRPKRCPGGQSDAATERCAVVQVDAPAYRPLFTRR